MIRKILGKEKIEEKTKVNYHTMEISDIFAKLNSNIEGLSSNEAEKRIERHGENSISEGRKKTLVGKFFAQFKDIMVIILLVAAGISGFLSEITDMIIILAVILVNAVLGVLQENKAEKAMDALKKMSSPVAKVRRDGVVQTIDTKYLVPGDVVLLDAGDFVPADLRLIECASLQIEEAALTGESVPSDKSADCLGIADIVIGDRKNMGYAGTSVTYGRGVGVVTSTGMNTEVGKIAESLKSEDEHQTPLQKKLEELGKYLTIGIVVISALIFFAGVLQGRDKFEMFLTAVSLAVAAIPEGLPAVVTIVLAIGVSKMAEKKAIVRKLSAVETLGSTEVICSDKTGTLTQNKMTVREVYCCRKFSDADSYRVSDESMTLLNAIALCNDSKVNVSDNGDFGFIGDPTETALLSFAMSKGIVKSDAESKTPRVDEIPFDSDRKLMSTINQLSSGYLVCTKGAPDVLISRCSKIQINGKPANLTEEEKFIIISRNADLASKALRVIAVAVKEIDNVPEDLSSSDIENDLMFVGLIGMIDPPRLEAAEAVRKCAKAGIRPIMITGDHKDTATAIARELGIIKNDTEVITGSELNNISDSDFESQVIRYSVYARVSPEHKVRIVDAWQKRGKVVAMTGDGVNDAPALKRAEIGIGMGITGTDVSKGVSDMILADDNFSTIVVAVEEGRKIYNNIRKTIQFLLSSNLGEIVTLFVATMLNSMILFPIHILWVNLVTDSLPALALGMGEGDRNAMNQRPRSSKLSFFAHGMGARIIYHGLIKGGLTLAAFYFAQTHYSHEVAVTVAFATLGLIQLTASLSIQVNDDFLFKKGAFRNKYLIGAVTVAAILQIIVIIIPGLNDVFRVVALNLEQWLVVFAASLIVIPAIEITKGIEKMIRRKI